MEFKVYTVPEVAELFKVSKFIIYEEVKQGKLKCHRIGRNIRITTDHIQEYLNETEPKKVRDLKNKDITKTA